MTKGLKLMEHRFYLKRSIEYVFIYVWGSCYKIDGRVKKIFFPSLMPFKYSYALNIYNVKEFVLNIGKIEYVILLLEYYLRSIF